MCVSSREPGVQAPPSGRLPGLRVSAVLGMWALGGGGTYMSVLPRRQPALPGLTGEVPCGCFTPLSVAGSEAWDRPAAPGSLGTQMGMARS